MNRARIFVGRSSYPTRLTTSAAETFHAHQALEILGNLQATRNMMRGMQAGGADMIEFAVPHTLAFTFFPTWLMRPAPALRRDEEGRPHRCSTCATP